MLAGMNKRGRLRNLSLSVSVSALAAGFVALAVSPAVAQNATPAATETAVDNLLKGLVDQGVLTKKKASILAGRFHSDLQAGTPSAPPPVAAVPTAVPPAERAANVVRVPYVSETVKDQIKDQVKSEVVAQAKSEHWATPNTFPEWVSHIRLYGDVRVRDEGRNFGKDNSNEFVDTAAINAGSAVDINPNSSKYAGLPVVNSTQDRNYVRLRARLGVMADIDDDWTAAIRLATGSDTSPTSTNQTLGSDFGKKSIWLDQAYIKYAPDTGWGDVSFSVGRMQNPFDKTELVWDDDINPDGAAASFAHAFGASGFSLKATAAAFTLDGASDGAPANALSNQKYGESTNRWLFAGQLGAKYGSDRLSVGLDAAYYDYDGVQSQLSAPCSNVVAGQTGCSTDATRPTFMQKGNTLFLLRDITDPNNTGADPQYFGLASKFQVLDLLTNLDYRAWGNFHVVLTGDFARNLGYDRNAITALPIVNNNETCVANAGEVLPSGTACTATDPKTGQPYGQNVYKSGNTAWFAQVVVGDPIIARRWDWNVAFSYRYIEPDALLDAFTDSDFHLGGTNARGWTIGANLGVARNTWFTAKWLSADAVTGPAYSIDVGQIDLTTRF